MSGFLDPRETLWEASFVRRDRPFCLPFSPCTGAMRKFCFKSTASKVGRMLQSILGAETRVGRAEGDLECAPVKAATISDSSCDKHAIQVRKDVPTFLRFGGIAVSAREQLFGIWTWASTFRKTISSRHHTDTALQ